MTRLIDSLTKRLNITFSDFEKFGVKTEAELVHFADVTIDFGSETIEHIFKGQVKTTSSGVLDLKGFHYENADSIVKVIPGTEVPINSFGAYEAKIEAGGVLKSANNGYSSFFPKSWSRQDVVDNIYEAFQNRYWQDGNLRRGTAKNGMKIEMALDADGRIITAYPIP